MPLHPGGGAVGALMSARDELEQLATSPGGLHALASARARRDALVRVVLELGFSADNVARFAGVREDTVERIAR